MEKGKIYTMPTTVKTGMAVLTSDKVDFRAKILLGIKKVTS